MLIVIPFKKGKEDLPKVKL